MKTQTATEYLWISFHRFGLVWWAVWARLSAWEFVRFHMNSEHSTYEYDSSVLDSTLDNEQQPEQYITVAEPPHRSLSGECTLFLLRIILYGCPFCLYAVVRFSFVYVPVALQNKQQIFIWFVSQSVVRLVEMLYYIRLLQINRSSNDGMEHQIRGNPHWCAHSVQHVLRVYIGSLLKKSSSLSGNAAAVAAVIVSIEG